MKTYTLEELQGLADEFVGRQDDTSDSRFTSQQREASDILAQFLNELKPPYQPQPPYYAEGCQVIDSTAVTIATAGTPEMAAAIVAAANQEPKP